MKNSKRIKSTSCHRYLVATLLVLMMLLTSLICTGCKKKTSADETASTNATADQNDNQTSTKSDKNGDQKADKNADQNAGQNADGSDSETDTTDGSDKLDPGVEEIGGVKVRKKTRMMTYLFMGIDSSEKRSEQAGGGQCDTLRLLVIDQNMDTIATVPINRDMYVEMDLLDENGKKQGRGEMQICLSHAQGKGDEKSCENTVKAIEDFLGIEITGYAAINMDAIGTLNNLAGGVEVTLEDDFTASDAAMKKGATLTLTDRQAEIFCRGRMEVGDGTNEGRMRRQETYLNGLQKNLKEKIAGSESFAQKIFDNMAPYMVTNLTGKDVSKLAKAVLKNEDLGRFEITGRSEMDEYDYMAFYPDPDSVAEVVRNLWYEEVK